MKKINTLILAAGKFDVKNISAGMITEVGLLPIRGKPAIGWIIDSAKKNGATDIKIVLRQNNTRLSRFLNYRYPEVEQVLLGENEEMAISLIALLNLCENTVPTQIILGDTLLQGDFPTEGDVFLSSEQIKASKNWCLVEKNEENHIVKVYNKQRDIPLEGKEALIGYYRFSDTKLLKEIALNQISRKDEDFMQILIRYNQIKPVEIQTTDQWYDFGHISGAVQARLGLFSAREFNSLKVDAIRGTITKTSGKKQKLLDEVYWYQALPPELSSFVPRVFNVTECTESVSVEMELYGYMSLAETFLYGSNNLEDWYNITEALLKVHGVFEKYTTAPDYEELKEIYACKTQTRLNEIKEKVPHVAKMMTGDDLIINQKRYRNYNLLREAMEKETEKLLHYDKRTIVHGDYCFSNILFDPMHYIFKVVDPRGRFKTQTIYGDPRYDIAKLRHSIVGLYDFIVAGLYKIKQTDQNQYTFQISTPLITAKLEPFFDRLIQTFGYNPKEIKFIEALLFLTMIPLHGDDEERQRAFYLTSIRKLNEVLYDEEITDMH